MHTRLHNAYSSSELILMKYPLRIIMYLHVYYTGTWSIDVNFLTAFQPFTTIQDLGNIEKGKGTLPIPESWDHHL